MSIEPKMALNLVPLKNPTFDNRSGIPKERGHVRGEGETFEYEDPRDMIFKPAVRLADIRPRLIEEYPPSKYVFKKECGYDATDVTTFLEKDAAYGSDREHRPPLLFQIFATDTSQDRVPEGFMMDGSRIVLDAFDHGIREFPGILPHCLSSELAGHDIMYYFRQNENLALYDLIARQPDGYHELDGANNLTWHEGPPRYGTVGMRATRFRLHAGLLTWKKRMGSDARNAKILSFIPAECKDPRVNSTRTFRDLTQAERDAVANILKGTAPTRAPKVKKGEKVGEEKHEGGDEPSNIRDTSYNNKESPESSGNESDKPMVKRIRKNAPMPGRNRPKNTFVSNRSIKGGSRRVTGSSQGLADTLPPSNAINKVTSTRRKAKSAISNNNINNSQARRGESITVQNHQPLEGQPAKPEKANNDYLTQEESDLSQHNDPLTVRMASSSAFVVRHERQRIAPNPPLPSPLPHLDYRRVVPNIDPANVEDNIAAIQEALELSRIDYFQQTGWQPRPSLVEEHKDQPYIMQHHALQQEFGKAWGVQKRRGMVPKLFCLAEWRDGFRNWRIETEKAQELYLRSIGQWTDG